LQRHGDKIFGLYQRFHHHPDSKGLGLYIINSQVRALGGMIDVQSEEGVGTTFIVSFKKN
jgi:signal transduction histidine kinase